jgi:hypothetical protein
MLVAGLFLFHETEKRTLGSFAIRQLAFFSMVLSAFVAFASPNTFLLGARAIVFKHNTELADFFLSFVEG